MLRLGLGPAAKKKEWKNTVVSTKCSKIGVNCIQHFRCGCGHCYKKFTFYGHTAKRHTVDEGMVERRPNRVGQRQSEKWNWPRWKDRMKRLAEERRRIKNNNWIDRMLFCVFIYLSRSFSFVHHYYYIFFSSRCTLRLVFSACMLPEWSWAKGAKTKEEKSEVEAVQ